MSQRILKEEPLQFGAGGRLFGILTEPEEPKAGTPTLPVFVLLNSGFLHRAGPHRLPVRLARKLAAAGFYSLRVDLAGNGDSPARDGLTSHQSVAADFAEIVAMIDRRLGPAPIVLGGLCSGADNSIRLTPSEPRVVGMVLLDPVCDRDAGFAARERLRKYRQPERYRVWLRKRLEELRHRPHDEQQPADMPTLRDYPSMQQLQAALTAIRDRRGRVLAVFTEAAANYYNQQGQMGRVVGVDGCRQFCTELYWPEAEHTYTLEMQRARLIAEIGAWAGAYAGERS